MFDFILRSLAPSSQNNARQIVKGALEKYGETKSLRDAQFVEDVTGHYPDSMSYTSAPNGWPMEEDRLIRESINDDTKIY